MTTKPKEVHAKEGRSPRWVRIDERVYSSPAWRSLSGPATRLWIDLRTFLNGFNNGKIVATRTALLDRGWSSNDVRDRALNELVVRGFLRYTRKCGRNTFHRASWLRFTDIPCPADEANGIAGTGPTDEYLRWQEPPKATSSTKAPRLTYPARRVGSDSKRTRETGHDEPGRRVTERQTNPGDGSR